MAKAIYVSLRETYPELNDQGRERSAHGIHNATTCWWRINLERARDAEYLFGVYRGEVVSAYKIVAPVEQWPIVRTHSADRMVGRKAIPAEPLSDRAWHAALHRRFRVPQGGVGYGTIDERQLS